MSLTICLLLVSFVGGAGCHCFDLRKMSLIYRQWKQKLTNDSKVKQHTDVTFCFQKWFRKLSLNIALILPQNIVIIHFINSPYDFSIQNCPKRRDRVQLRFQSPKRFVIKHLKQSKLYSVAFLRTEMTSEPSKYRRENLPLRFVFSIPA